MQWPTVRLAAASVSLAAALAPAACEKNDDEPEGSGASDDTTPGPGSDLAGDTSAPETDVLCDASCTQSEACGYASKATCMDTCEVQFEVADAHSSECSAALAAELTCTSKLDCEALATYLAAAMPGFPCEAENTATTEACG